jgi:hypothetical protein
MNDIPTSHESVTTIVYPEINFLTRQYWPEEVIREVECATTMSDLTKIAKSIIEKMRTPIVQVCGPISSGGKGNVTDNLFTFSKAIAQLQTEGHSVFDQMPFEKNLHRIIKGMIYEDAQHAILHEFYEPIFDTGKIKTLYFLPDWKSSNGARWEHAHAEKRGIEIAYL